MKNISKAWQNKNFVKVAIVHDYLKEFGGAEKVVEALLEVFPKAQVYTAVFLPKYQDFLFAVFPSKRKTH